MGKRKKCLSRKTEASPKRSGGRLISLRFLFTYFLYSFCLSLCQCRLYVLYPLIDFREFQTRSLRCHRKQRRLAIYRLYMYIRIYVYMWEKIYNTNSRKHCRWRMHGGTVPLHGAIDILFLGLFFLLLIFTVEFCGSLFVGLLIVVVWPMMTAVWVAMTVPFCIRLYIYIYAQYYILLNLIGRIYSNCI